MKTILETYCRMESNHWILLFTEYHSVNGVHYFLLIYKAEFPNFFRLNKVSEKSSTL